MSEYVTEWVAAMLPQSTRSAVEMLASYGLPETYEQALAHLVRTRLHVMSIGSI